MTLEEAKDYCENWLYNQYGIRKARLANSDDFKRLLKSPGFSQEKIRNMYGLEPTDSNNLILYDDRATPQPGVKEQGQQVRQVQQDRHIRCVVNLRDGW